MTKYEVKVDINKTVYVVVDDSVLEEDYGYDDVCMAAEAEAVEQISCFDIDSVIEESWGYS